MGDLSRMKNGGDRKRGVISSLATGLQVLMCISAVALLPSAWAADEKGEKKEKSNSSSLGDLFNSLKDMKVPDSVSKFPEQMKELKDAYLKTAKTVEELQKEVVSLREEVKALQAEQALLKKGGVTVSGTGGLVGSSLEVKEMTAEQLVSAYAEDSKSAKQEYDGRYVKVRGAIHGFETGNKKIVIFLRADTSDSRVKCNFKRDDNFHVEVVASQGRLVSRNDRTTLLTIGQPVTIIGTCTGSIIDVTMMNCHMEGIASKRQAESK